MPTLMKGARASARGCLGLAAVVVLTTACSQSPSRSIMGAYFPAWMICALLGISGALLARALLSATGLLDEVPVLPVVLLALAIAITMGLWLVWLA